MLRWARVTPFVLLFPAFVACADHDQVEGEQGGKGGAGEEARAQPLIPGTEAYDCRPPNGSLPQLRLAPVARGLDRPIFVTHAPNDTARLFVLEQKGTIIVLDRSQREDGEYDVLEVPFLDLRPRVVSTGVEQGLLGLAFHPNYQENGLFYVYYTASAAVGELEEDTENLKEGDVLLEEYAVSDEPDRADPETARRVLHIPKRNPIHQAGTLAFGVDGYLYVSVGDDNGGKTAEIGTANKLDVLIGKVLRIDPTSQGADAYGTPAGNLQELVNDARPEIWDYGLRNPYRMNFDACTGDLYIGDVGDKRWEEIDIEAYGQGRKNYGWPLVEGLVCGPRTPDCDLTASTPPVTVIGRIARLASIVGGAVYRGSEIPALRGAYIYAITQSGSFFTLRFDGKNITEPQDLTDDVNPLGDDKEVITSIQNGGDGEIYTTGYISGRITKLSLE